jgi:hypothetical protein
MSLKSYTLNLKYLIIQEVFIVGLLNDYFIIVVFPGSVLQAHKFVVYDFTKTMGYFFYTVIVIIFCSIFS